MCVRNLLCGLHIDYHPNPSSTNETIDSLSSETSTPTTTLIEYCAYGFAFSAFCTITHTTHSIVPKLGGTALSALPSRKCEWDNGRQTARRPDESRASRVQPVQEVTAQLGVLVRCQVGLYKRRADGHCLFGCGGSCVYLYDCCFALAQTCFPLSCRPDACTLRR